MKDNQSIDCAAYERPAVEILEVAVECGFIDSPVNYDDITGESSAGELYGEDW